MIQMHGTFFATNSHMARVATMLLRFEQFAHKTLWDCLVHSTDPAGTETAACECGRLPAARLIFVPIQFARSANRLAAVGLVPRAVEPVGTKPQVAATALLFATFAAACEVRDLVTAATWRVCHVHKTPIGKHWRL